MEDTRIERIRGWSDRDIGGPADLDTGFTGAIDASGRWVLVLDGQCVAGDPDWLESGGTAYRAPHDALPLLFAMEDADGETQGRYYSEEADLRETHETLSDAGFTGYIELAENVLSGDYYVVYHGGQSRSVGFQGNNGRLITDDEAFETAADEVGIYTIESASIDPQPLPEPAESPAADEADASAAGAAAGGTEDGDDAPLDEATDDGAAAGSADDGDATTAAATAQADVSDEDAPGSDDATAAATGKSAESDAPDGTAAGTAGDDPSTTAAGTAHADDPGEETGADPEPDHADADAASGGGEESAPGDAPTPADGGESTGSAEGGASPESSGAETDPGSRSEAGADDAATGAPGGLAPPSGEDGKEPAQPSAPAETSAPATDTGDAAAESGPSGPSGDMGTQDVSTADAAPAGEGGAASHGLKTGSGNAPAALSSSGDVAAVEQTVDQIADRVSRIDRQLDEVTETLDQLVEGTGDEEFAVSPEDADEDAADDEGVAGRSWLPYVVLAVVLLLVGIAAVHVFTGVTVPGMDSLVDGLRSVAGLASELGI